MFSNDSHPIRPPRRRRAHSRSPPEDESEAFCGQFPNRLKRNFSTDFLPQNNQFLEAFPPKRFSNLEINRTLSQNAFVSPFVPLFGPNIHPLMGQMWRPLRHSQTQVILPKTQPIVPKREVPKKSGEVVRSDQKAVNGVKKENKTFEDHFNQYKSERKEIKEPKEPEIDFHFRYESPRKSVFGTLKAENKGTDMRKGSLPTVCPELETKDLTSMNRKTPKVLKKKREEWALMSWLWSESLIILVVVVNLILLICFYFLFI